MNSGYFAIENETKIKINRKKLQAYLFVTFSSLTCFFWFILKYTICDLPYILNNFKFTAATYL